MSNHLYDESIALHKKLAGKLSVTPKIEVTDKNILSLVYTPGVAGVCNAIAENPVLAYDLTIKGNTVAVLSDGSAVLGLGNIGPEAALPVMEGKALLFKQFAGIDAFPICVNTQNTFEIINLVRNIAPVFGGINLEDIAAPRCFEIEQALQDIGIPVFHDDQHGTAIVLLAAMINASSLAGKSLQDLKVVVCGAGAAGTAISELLLCVGYDPSMCQPVREILVCDSRGILARDRPDIQNSPFKMKLAAMTNRSGVTGTLADAVRGADVFIGVSKGGLLTGEMVKTMAEKPIVLAMANPIPEIEPSLAYASGAFIVGTGRSDTPNQVNNLLAFPGVFRGALDARASRITNHMKICAAFALARSVTEPRVDAILPSPLDPRIVGIVAQAVAQAIHSKNK
ncbi:MAG: NADP-dependent malic enzyme [Nitrospirae bacterium]|nr:NADP-dependent malic enzyme [Magnetococcales bacterium]HAT50289.1 NAD-dependent malic enzyme [Alphaproteobacteria bacterium]